MKFVDPQLELARTLLSVGDRKSNVVLTGFMATGKSTVGRLLAVRSDASYIDTDEMIVGRHGSIEEIFATKGEAAFREMERNIASELEGTAGLVIATGGRFMLDQDCAAALGSTGRVFCLVASIEEIKRRLLTDEDGLVRPLLTGSNETQLELSMKNESRRTRGSAKSRPTEDLSRKLSNRSKLSSVRIETSDRYCSGAKPVLLDKKSEITCD